MLDGRAQEEAEVHRSLVTVCEVGRREGPEEGADKSGSSMHLLCSACKNQDRLKHLVSYEEAQKPPGRSGRDFPRKVNCSVHSLWLLELTGQTFR